VLKHGPCLVSRLLCVKNYAIYSPVTLVGSSWVGFFFSGRLDQVRLVG
jgi:hypothetical protein